MKKRRPASRTDSSTSTRSRGRRIIQSVLVLVGCVLLVDALVGENGFLEILRARQQHRSLETSLYRARTENAQLREQARRLREDPAAIEDLARREHGMIRPGELLFILKDLAPEAQ